MFQIVTPTPAAPAPTRSMSIFDLIIKGGPVMIPIIILSIIAVFVIIERLITIRQAMKHDANLIPSIKDHIHNGNIKAAKQLCEKLNTPTSRLISKGLTRVGRPLKEIEASMENTGKLEMARLEKRIPILAIVSGAAPMVGFLGTVIGMMIAFNDIAAQGNVDIKGIADGINVKMVTSASGLIVGIIAYFGYNILTMMVNKVVNQMETASLDFIEILEEPTN
ncbi:MAG: MotA/TolQ/ExbB proton channel family protein [Bacteroidetes bacterium]|nr:MotA/TolQ/ExbB proton channel family protein [Bacteroidota bacterium]